MKARFTLISPSRFPGSWNKHLSTMTTPYLFFHLDSLFSDIDSLLLYAGTTTSFMENSPK